MTHSDKWKWTRGGGPPVWVLNRVIQTPHKNKVTNNTKCYRGFQHLMDSPEPMQCPMDMEFVTSNVRVSTALVN